MGRIVRLLFITLLIVWSPIGYSTDESELVGTWVAHPSDPGNDVPLSGSSLFDILFKLESGNEYKIPFPFESLVKSLDAMVMGDEEFPVPVALIPKGRSLQRESAAPDYFLFPRQVLAVVEEPSSRQMPLLRNRFFLGYQEKAEQLEVISYNDAEGRFEFQLVENYARNKKSEVRYASRATCMSCHQNAGPIFSRSPWDETNYNLKIAAGLNDANPGKFVNPLAAMSKEPGVVDYSTDYANYFSTAQLGWNNGCGTNSKISVLCRGALLNAVIQLGLNGGLAFDESDNRYVEFVSSHIDSLWDSIWPGGLLIPTADIPDLDEFDSPGAIELDPLVQREPRAYWKKPNAVFYRGIAQRLVDFISLPEYQAIDQILVNLEGTAEQISMNYAIQCTYEVDTSVVRGKRLHMSCNSVSTDQLALKFEIRMDDNAISQSFIHKLSFPGNNLFWRPGFLNPNLDLSKDQFSLVSHMENAELGISARAPNGNRLKTLELNLENFPMTSLGNGEPTVGELKVIWVHDYSIVESAIDSMINDSGITDTGALVAGPFNRSLIIPELFDFLQPETLARSQEQH